MCAQKRAAMREIFEMALHFTQAEFAGRRAKLQAAMADAGFDGLLLFNPSSHFWLTGYDTFGFCFFQCLVVKADGSMVLLTRSADLRQAQLTSIIEDIRIWKDGVDANPATDLAKLIAELGLDGGTLGIEYETQGLTAANGMAVQAALSGQATLQDASRLVTRLRLVKSAAELAYVEKAAEICDKALDAALALAHPGGHEARILAAMHEVSFAEGGDYPGNPFIVGSGDHALLCRYQSGRRALGAQDQLTLEWAGVMRQYHVAAMRTIPIGPVTDLQERLFAAAREALLACEAELRPGRTMGDVFAAHAKTLDAHGLAAHRLNACGYSLGTVYAPCWMDWPMFYEGNPVELAPNMVMFLHMIIMDSDTQTAMCLGRTSLVEANGARPLSRHPLELLAGC